MILIKLAHTVECGTTMEGGRRIYERVNVSSEEGGEWFTRQFVTDVEAKFFMGVDNRVKAGSPVNVIMGGVRGLPRVTEFDECVLRMTLNNYKAVFKGDIRVFISSLTHEWGPNSSELREEPIIFVCVRWMATCWVLMNWAKSTHHSPMGRSLRRWYLAR